MRILKSSSFRDTLGLRILSQVEPRSFHAYRLTTPAIRHMIDRVLVGSRLRAHRKQQKFTLKQVSEKSGVALSTLSKMG